MWLSVTHLSVEPDVLVDSKQVVRIIRRLMTEAGPRWSNMKLTPWVYVLSADRALRYVGLIDHDGFQRTPNAWAWSTDCASRR